MHTQLTIMAYNFPSTNSSAASFGSSAHAHGNETSFEASDHDFFELNDWFDEDIPAFTSFSAGYNPHHANYTPNEVFSDSGRTSNNSFCDGAMNNRDSERGRQKKEIGDKLDKVAFKTKSDIEVLDDGFKWRKYGKKMVKNSPNPRNYYRCSVEGCPVKKRVERDKEDRRYVVTTYEGIHNHESPTI